METAVRGTWQPIWNVAVICMDIVIFPEESNTGWKTVADRQTQLFHLCDRYFNCVMN